MIPLSKVYVDAGLCKSGKDFKRMVKERSLRLGDVVLEDTNWFVSHVEGTIVVVKPDGDNFIVHEGCINKPL